MCVSVCVSVCVWVYAESQLSNQWAFLTTPNSEGFIGLTQNERKREIYGLDRQREEEGGRGRKREEEGAEGRT